MDMAKMECSKMNPGKPRISVVWKYFKMDSEDKSKVVCQICEEQLKFSGSTTSMKYHLTRHSALISLNIGLPPSKAKHSIKSGFKPSQQDCSSSPSGRQEVMTANLVNMCLMDLIPTTLVDGQGFRQFLHYVEPSYTIPSHQALNRRIVALYDSRKCCLLSEIRHCQDVTISVERWDAKDNAVFLTVTAHFITSDWEFQSRILNSEILSQNPTAEAIAEIVSSSVKSYGICDSSVVAVIHANDQEVSQSYALLGWHHFPCFAQTLSHCVAVALGIPAVAALVTVCRDVVDYILACPTLVVNIEARQKAEGATRRRFLRDVEGHWPSTFQIMEAVNEQRQIIFEVIKETLEYDAFPKALLRSEKEWTQVKAVIEALRPLDTVREMLSAETHVILSTVVPVLFSLVSVHMKINANDEEIVRNLKQVVEHEMKSQFSFDSNAFPESFGIMTTVLDPRHKSLPFLNELQRSTVKTKLTTLVEENRAATAAQESDRAAVDGGDSHGPRYSRDEDSDDEVAVKRPKPTVAEFLSPIYDHSCDSGGSEASRTRSEVEAYLQEMAASLSSNPLTWWKLCSYKYPNLSKLARRMLCIPATAVPPAQAFSGTLDPERRKRTALDLGIVDKMIFLNRNMASGEFQLDNVSQLLEESDSCFPQMAMLSPEALETMPGSVGQEGPSAM